VFGTFVLAALYFDGHADLFAFDKPLGLGKLVVWAAFVGFAAFSVYCSLHENLFKAVGKISELHWGRQIGTDLYLGLWLTLFVMYLNEGSLLVVGLWLLPTLAFANLATLLYFAIHFDEIVAKLSA
jgi:hypothetical protein